MQIVKKSLPWMTRDDHFERAELKDLGPAGPFKSNTSYWDKILNQNQVTPELLSGLFFPLETQLQNWRETTSRRSKSQAVFVSESICRLLSHVKDVAVRSQLTELLVEVEAIKIYDERKEALEVWKWNSGDVLVILVMISRIRSNMDSDTKSWCQWMWLAWQ